MENSIVFLVVSHTKSDPYSCGSICTKYQSDVNGTIVKLNKKFDKKCFKNTNIKLLKIIKWTYEMNSKNLQFWSLKIKIQN